MSKSKREAELEDRVDELEDTVKKMLPGRRDVLLAAGAGIAGAAGAGNASASGHNDGDTQWGTSSNRDDYIVDHLDAISLDTDEGLINEPRGGVAPSGRVSFSTEFVKEPLSDNETDPVIVHRRHFDDDKYRIITANGSQGTLPLYTTTDFSSFTQETSDLGYFTSGNGNNFQDHVVLDDGTFVLYDSKDDTDTRVWTGTSLTSLSLEGTVVTGEADCGAFLNSDTDTIHIYTEDADNAVTGEPTSNALSHYTTNTTNLTSATQQSNAVDVTGKSWHTGDPDIIHVGEYYYMFIDNSTSHPTYNIALARSADLYNWTVVNDNITPQQLGGDIAVTRRGGIFEALTEFTGSNEAGIGHWRLTATPVANNLNYGGKNLDITEGTTGERRVSVEEASAGEFYSVVHEASDTEANSNSVGHQIRDDTGTVRANWAYSPSADMVFFDAGSTEQLRMGVRGTGSQEVVIRPTGSTSFDRQGSNVWNLYDDQGMDQAAQDLGALSLTSTENGHIYRHNGASSINADGATTSSPGYYAWDNSAAEFKSIVQF